MVTGYLVVVFSMLQLHTYLVLDLLEGGELLDKIRSQAKFTEAEASRIMRSLVTAVDFLHSNGIIHRDLKPEVLRLILYRYFITAALFGVSVSSNCRNGSIQSCRFDSKGS